MPYADPEAQRAYQRAWVAARRAKWLEGQACVDCGSVESLEVDHIDSSKKVTHRLWSWAARRDAELAKCVVRCTGCHHIKTLAMDHPRTDHGRGQMYHLGCRCDECRAWKSASDRLYRRRASESNRVGLAPESR